MIINLRDILVNDFSHDFTNWNECIRICLVFVTIINKPIYKALKKSNHIILFLHWVPIGQKYRDKLSCNQ